MAYAPRRRGGIAKEVASFATAFTQGMKLFSDDDRGGRARARDPYSDESISKGDDRLGSTGALGKFFGMGKDELSDLDRGILATNKKIDLARSRGDVDKLQKYTSDAMALQKLKAAESGGSKPAGALPVKPKDTGGTPEPKARPDEFKQAEPAVDAPSFGVSPPESSQPLVPVPGTGINSPGFSRTSADGGDGFSSERGAGDEISPAILDSNAPESKFDAAVLTDKDPDYTGSSIFDMGVDVARGGMIPALYAARGMSVPSRTGSTYGEEDFGFIPEGSDDEGFGATPGPEPTPPTPPGTPSVEDDERGDRTANLGLSRDPEELAVATIPAVKAGLNRIQDELRPSGAISAQDPAYQEKLQKFARGQGRMSDEEIREIDAVIDPDGTLPDASKSAARLAGIYKFYQDRGDPETASTVAARIILYNKFAAQTRGAMALQAINDGDLESGVRLLADAQNKDNPDGKTARGSVNPDGTINFELGWDKLTGFERTEGGRATKEDMVKLAQATASGVRTMSDLSVMENALKGKTKGAPPTAAATNRAAAATSAEKFTTALGEVTAAAKGVAAARASGDPDAIKAADDALEAAKTKALSGASSDNVIAQRRSAIRAAIAQAIPSAVPTAKPPTSVEERKAAAEASEMDALYRERVGIEGGALAARGTAAGGVDVRSRVPVTEATAAEIARRSYGSKTPGYYPADAGTGALSDVQRTENLARTAGAGYSRAPDAPKDAKSDANINALAKPYMDALLGTVDEETGKPVSGIINRAQQDAEGRVDPNAPKEKIDSRERQQFTDIFGRLAQKNKSLSRESLAETVYDIARPRARQIMSGARPEIDWRTKEVVYNGKRLLMDEASIRDLAAMRGKTINDFFASEKQAAGESRAKPVQALQTKLSGYDKALDDIDKKLGYLRDRPGGKWATQIKELETQSAKNSRERNLVAKELEGYGSEYVSGLAKKKK